MWPNLKEITCDQRKVKSCLYCFSVIMAKYYQKISGVWTWSVYVPAFLGRWHSPLRTHTHTQAHTYTHTGWQWGQLKAESQFCLFRFRRLREFLLWKEEVRLRERNVCSGCVRTVDSLFHFSQTCMTTYFCLFHVQYASLSIQLCGGRMVLFLNYCMFVALCLDKSIKSCSHTVHL